MAWYPGTLGMVRVEWRDEDVFEHTCNCGQHVTRMTAAQLRKALEGTALEVRGGRVAR